MNEIAIALDSGRTTFAPGERISGKTEWNLPQAPKRIAVRLFWFTQGKGTRDVGVAEELAVENPSPSGEKLFSFTAPDEPPSFSGRLVSVCWALEAVAEPGDSAARIDIVVSPSGKEIDISQQVHDDESPEHVLRGTGCLFSPVSRGKTGRPS